MLIRIVDTDREAIEAEVDLLEGRLDLIANVKLADDVLVLYDLHIEGPGQGRLGVARLRQIVYAVMETYDVKALEIHGFRRTTGANAGRVPSVLRFSRR